MKQFINVLKFELMGYLKNKIFVGITLAFIIISGLVLSFPHITSIIKSSDEPKETEKQIMLLSDTVSKDSSVTMKMFQDGLPDMIISLSDKTKEELTELVSSGEAKCAVILNSSTEYTYIVDKIGLYDKNQSVIEQIMLENHQLNSMVSLGISQANASNLISATIDSSVVQIGKDGSKTFFYTYILVFALYIAILMYGQLVATSIATEKSSRAMEMLITSAKPESLMFGKIIGSGLAGLIQLSAILIFGAVFWLLNKDLWGENQAVNSIFSIPSYLLFFMILFFMLGFFIYAFLFGAVGSLASRVEDINTTTMPIIMVFIVAFIIVMTSMVNGNVDSTIMIIASYVPLTSPMAMFVRISMSEVSPIAIFVSVAILIASTVGIGYLSSKIYRAGVLMYGKPPKLTSFLKKSQ